jgi:Terminase small subunit
MAKMSKNSPKPRAVTGRPDRKLTLPEERFCAEYVVDFDAEAANKRAGLRTGAYKQLVKACVQQRIRDLVKAVNDKALGQAVDVLEETKTIAMGDLTDFLACPTVEALQALPAEKRRLIKSIKMVTLKGFGDEPDRQAIEKVELWSREWALKLLGERDKVFIPPPVEVIHKFDLSSVNPEDAADAYQRMLGQR